MTDQEDFKPVYKDGEPRCTREDCPAFHKSGWEQYEPSTCGITGYKHMHDCVPALRRDRDAFLRERDEARREMCRILNNDPSLRWASEVKVAEAYGWAYLYEEKK